MSFESYFWGLPWERDIVAQRAVADNPDGMTYEEIGALYGLSKQRVEQIYSSALKKIREAGGLCEFVGESWALPAERYWPPRVRPKRVRKAGRSRRTNGSRGRLLGLVTYGQRLRMRRLTTAATVSTTG